MKERRFSGVLGKADFFCNAEAEKGQSCRALSGLSLVTRSATYFVVVII